MTPTQRTLAEARKMGFTAGITEKWNPHARIRQDLFGFIDLILIHEGCGIIAVQTCAGSSHAARRAKIEAEPRAKEWLLAGGRIEIWSWDKQGPRGRAKRWTLRREEIAAEPRAKTWLNQLSGGRIKIWSWDRREEVKDL